MIRLLLGLVSVSAVANAASPVVSVTSPLAGQVIGKLSTFSARCVDDKGVTAVQFKVDNVQLGSIEKLPPFEQPFDPSKFKAGPHSVTAFCTDTGNNITKSAPVSFSVVAPTPIPSPSPSLKPSPSPSPSVSVEAGWISLPKSVDTREVYVSTFGNDAADGKTPSSPVKSFSKALSLVRSGFPDHVYFKRGDTFTGFFAVPNGRSATEPFVVADYGDLNLERPKFLITGAGTLYNKFCGVNKTMQGLHIYAFKRDPKAASFDSASNKEENGFRCAGGMVQNLSFIDNKFEYLRQPLDFDGVYQHTLGQPAYKNFLFYRNVIIGAWASGSGVRDRMAEGLYISLADGVRLIENIWFQNGWNPNISDSRRSYLNHSIYLKEISNLEVRGNITALSSGLAFKFDSLKLMNNVTIDNNFAIGASNGIWVGSNDAIPNSYKNLVYSNNVHTNIGAIAQTDSGAYLDQGLGPTFNFASLGGSGNLCFRKNFSQMSSKCINTGNGTTGGVTGTVSWGWSTSEGNPAVVDSTRTLGTLYGRTDDGVGYFYSQIVLQRRGHWLTEFSAPAINTYFKSAYRLK